MFACIYAQKIAAGVSLGDFAYSFSPLVEETAADTVVIDTEGCELRFGSAYELAKEIAAQAMKGKDCGGLECGVNVAVAGNPDAAIHAARFYEGISFIAPGEELTGLGDLPVESLKFQISNFNDQGADPKVHSTKPQGHLDLCPGVLDEKQLDDILETLRLWGVRTFREFAALPLTGVSERLGQVGVILQQIAVGKTTRHLKLKQPAPIFQNSLELEHPISQLEPLAFIFARLLNQLCAALDAYALATNELRVQLKLENQEFYERVLNLPYPMRDNKVFLKLLLLDTEMHPPASAVVLVTIACEPVQPRVLQNGLFIPLAPEPEKLELTLARLIKLLGTENVGSPHLLDTHRPDAFCVKRFVLHKKFERKKSSGRKVSLPLGIRTNKCLLGFRIFRPPLQAIVEAARGYPTQISAWNKKLSVHGRVVRLAGPWRTSGDWWRLDSWARDEWDVAVSSGFEVSNSGGRNDASREVLYRIYRELRNGMWFVEGIYD